MKRRLKRSRIKLAEIKQRVEDQLRKEDEQLNKRTDGTLQGQPGQS